MKPALIGGIMLLSSCGLAEQDLYSSGGFVEHNYIDHLFPAGTQQQRFDRYLLSFSVLAPVALETSADAVQATSTINRVNATYGSLLSLLEAVESCGVAGDTADKPDCAAAQIEAGNPSAYAFETLTYELQSDLYFLSKQLIQNLNLDETAEDIVGLDIGALTSLSRRFGELLPVARRGAATYRDSVVLVADAVAKSCSGDADTMQEQTACKTLVDNMNNRYKDGQHTVNELDIRSLLTEAKQAARSHSWSMTNAQRRAAIYHVDRACERVFDYQKVDNDTGSYSNCSHVTDAEKTAAKKRNALWNKLN